MSIPLSAEELPLDKGRRRSLRVMLSVTVIVRGKNAEGNAFEEETKTLVVNAHGALIHLGTQEAQQSRIVYVGTTMHGGKAQVGIEFDKPAPKFWQISFPPED